MQCIAMGALYVRCLRCPCRDTLKLSRAPETLGMPTFSREDRIEMGVISTSWGWLLLLLHVACDSPCLHRTSWFRTACLTPTCVFGTDGHATHPCALCREFDQQLLQHRPQELYGPGAQDHHVLSGQPNKRCVWLPSTPPAPLRHSSVHCTCYEALVSH